jgi:hypothetical protein
MAMMEPFAGGKKDEWITPYKQVIGFSAAFLKPASKFFLLFLFHSGFVR